MPFNDGDDDSCPPTPKRRRRIVDVASIGSPPDEISHQETIRAIVYDFEKLPKNKNFTTTTLEAHGHSWRIGVHPKKLVSFEGEHTREYVCFSLSCFDVQYSRSKEVKATASIEFVRSGISESFSRPRTFDNITRWWGFGTMWNRSLVLSKCVDKEGTLVIDVHIQVYTKKKTTWTAKTTQTQRLCHRRSKPSITPKTRVSPSSSR